MFDGGLRGFFDDVVNSVRCIGADVEYKKSQLRRMYYQQSDEENENDSSSTSSKETENKEQETVKESSKPFL